MKQNNEIKRSIETKINSKFVLVYLMIIILVLPIGFIFSTRSILFTETQRVDAIWNDTVLSPNYMNGVVVWSTDVEYEIYSSPAIADIDKDGSIDIIICAGYFDKGGAIYCLESNGTIKWQKEYDKYIFSSPAVADLDKDGSLDIVFTCYDSFTYCLDFEGNEKWSYDMEGPSRSTPCIADLDGDGDLEIIIANTMISGGYRGKLSCLSSNGIEKWVNYTDTWYWASPTVADLFNDGKLEVLIGNLRDDRFSCYNFDGTWNWTFNTEPSTDTKGRSISGSAVVADIDNDLGLEIIFGDFSNITYCLNETGHEEWRYYGDGTVFISSPSLVDIDKDGYLEIIMPGTELEKNYGYIICINHDGSEEWLWRKDNLDWIVTTPTIADLNNNGEYEIIFSAIDNKTRILNSYGGYLPEWEMITMDLDVLGFPTVFSTAAVVDLDGDGILEIILGGHYTSAGKIWCISFSGFSSSGNAPYPTYRGSNFRTGAMDSDFDFIDDLTERTYFGTLEYNRDSDGDELIDGKELWYNADPLDPDTDDDGYTDGEEVRVGSKPDDPNSIPALDSDDDGLTDEEELALGTSINDDDSDNDGLKDGEEVHTYGTNATNFDTDGDELGDGEEIEIHETNPLDSDTDNDGMPDGWEIANGFDPLSASDANRDEEIDGLTNIEEYQYGTDPFDEDSDDDTISDGDEVHIHGTDPMNPADHPFLWQRWMTYFSVISGVIGFSVTVFSFFRNWQKRRKKKREETQEGVHAQKRLEQIQQEHDEPDEWGIDDNI
ncbi:MAG: hypothetical protein E3J70_03015 [Candidatus Heimdallarchaeota archaeon]|nr:MAG: hypothetical protein E3J70_03015 [Candidatus Heimdallarchaeota archaeon]